MLSYIEWPSFDMHFLFHWIIAFHFCSSYRSKACVFASTLVVWVLKSNHLNKNHRKHWSLTKLFGTYGKSCKMSYFCPESKPFYFIYDKFNDNSYLTHCSNLGKQKVRHRVCSCRHEWEVLLKNSLQMEAWVSSGKTQESSCWV